MRRLIRRAQDAVASFRRMEAELDAHARRLAALEAPLPNGWEPALNIMRRRQGITQFICSTSDPSPSRHYYLTDGSTDVRWAATLEELLNS